MRVISVRVFPEECRLEAYVRHEDKLLVVPLYWMSRVPDPTPPTNWYDMVCRQVTESLTQSKKPTSITDYFSGGRRR